MSRKNAYIYAILDRKYVRYWNGTGFTDAKRDAKVYRTEAEAEEPLRRMMRDNIKAKIGYVGVD